MTKIDKLHEKLLRKPVDMRFDEIQAILKNHRIVIQKDSYGGFFAEVEELQGCMTQGETYEEAYNNILEALAGWLEVALERGIAIPKPASESQYSGRFTLRIPRTLHKKLAQHAKRENVSLNQYAIHLLSQRETNP